MNIRNLIMNNEIKGLFDEFSKKHQTILDSYFSKDKTIRYCCYCSGDIALGANGHSSEISVCPHLLQELNFSKNELFACIAHEFGHLLNPLNGEDVGDIQREMDADKFACLLGYKEEIRSVVNKFLLMDDDRIYPKSTLNQRLSAIE